MHDLTSNKKTNMSYTWEWENRLENKCLLKYHVSWDVDSRMVSIWLTEDWEKLLVKWSLLYQKETVILKSKYLSKTGLGGAQI